MFPGSALPFLSGAILVLFAPFARANVSIRANTNASNTFNSLSNNSAEAWPAPNATGGTAWKDAFARAQSLVAQMTLEEKVTFITGQNGRCAGNTGLVERLGIPTLCLQDGPAGARPILGSSQFPAGQAVAATWDRELIYQRGYAMGQEFYDQGINIALSPVTGGPLGRAPRDGRLWEGFFADAYGTGEAAYATVKGMQDVGILTVAKHYIGYEQETSRNPYSVSPANVQLPISSNIDNKALHELYMWGFAEAVRVGTSFVMCSYNMLNETHSCSNAYTQNNLLKSELNFQGGIVSDWGAMWGNAEFINGGLDMGMPGVGLDGYSGDFWGENLIPYLENGTVPESRVDDAAIRILMPWIASGQADHPPPPITWNYDPPFFPTNNTYWHDVRKPTTAALIRQIGEDSATLLKNANSALPLRSPGTIAIIGSDAGLADIAVLAVQGQGLYQYPLGNMDGTLTLGGGSGWAVPPYLVSPFDAINYRGRRLGSQVYAIFNDTAYDAVANTALNADTTIVFVSAWSEESEDRASLYLDHDGEELITVAASNCNNTIVVVHSGGPVLVEEWIDNPNVTAVISAHYPGQESGDAITSVLFGDVSPSGKLPYTVAHSIEDYPPNTIIDDPVINPQSNFTESTLIDYRWFSAHNITPRFDFGYGLSYSSFSYSNIDVVEVTLPDNTTVQKTNEQFEGSDGANSLYDIILAVTADVTNTGGVSASEVSQLYVTLPGSEGIWLRGFDKLKGMAPGETRAATFQLRRKDLSLWSTERQLWYVPEGAIELHVGASSTRLQLAASWSSTTS